MSTAASRRRRPPSASQVGNGYTAADWEREFRYDVKDSLAAISETQQKMALLLEQYGNRIEALETRPREERAVANTANTRLAWMVGLGAVGVSLLTYLLQHVSFH